MVIELKFCGIFAKAHYLGLIQDGNMFFKKLHTAEREVLSSGQIYCLVSGAENGQQLSESHQA